MAQLTFETLAFRTIRDEVWIDLLGLATAKVPKEDLESIGEFKVVDEHTIEFVGMDQEKADVKFSFLLQKHFENLHTKVTGNKCTYIHQNSGIPLIGNVAFGIVYRGSSIIEIKPNNGCNLDCVYCSIAEGLSSKKNDFVVEKDYLVRELKKLVEFVDEEVEVHIGVQGEPFLYSDMINLIEDVQSLDNVHTISIDTNGSLLNEDKLDRLAKCDKLQLNLSLDAIDSDVAKKVAGTRAYDVEKVKRIISYASSRLKVIVAPVFTQGYNDEEMEKIIKWIKTLPVQPILGIQNFLRYKTGRNVAKEMPWDEFYLMLERLEKKHDIKLKLNKDDFNIRKTKELPKPFKVGDEVTAIVKCVDRFPNSVIAVCKDRSISVPGVKFSKDKKIQVRIVRDKHNIFVGKLL